MTGLTNKKHDFQGSYTWLIGSSQGLGVKWPNEHTDHRPKIWSRLGVNSFRTWAWFNNCDLC